LKNDGRNKIRTYGLCDAKAKNYGSREGSKLSIFSSSMYNIFCIQRHQINQNYLNRSRTEAFRVWVTARVAAKRKVARKFWVCHPLM